MVFITNNKAIMSNHRHTPSSKFLSLNGINLANVGTPITRLPWFTLRSILLEENGNHPLSDLPQFVLDAHSTETGERAHFLLAIEDNKLSVKDDGPMPEVVLDTIHAHMLRVEEQIHISPISGMRGGTLTTVHSSDVFRFAPLKTAYDESRKARMFRICWMNDKGYRPNEDKQIDGALYAATVIYSAAASASEGINRMAAASNRRIPLSNGRLGFLLFLSDPISSLSFRVSDYDDNDKPIDLNETAITVELAGTRYAVELNHALLSHDTLLRYFDKAEIGIKFRELLQDNFPWFIKAGAIASGELCFGAKHSNVVV